MAKQTFKEVVNDKAQHLLNAVALWGAFYRANPHRFAKDFWVTDAIEKYYNVELILEGE